ncbi:L-serine ammonia-lyase [Teichococcus oryzae]|uniref:L-serine dehydratase n=1 Tax=Teichococcus oryzae TaxID=1608942 RepID=A0A5B2TBU5_9PROT|nr:L-serine ammonia-lyase [Pseudoroseomonas oryzae]KAA2211991.1 L-serine ammonia-lyase [Pseudoroseomonas oryzae]
MAQLPDPRPSSTPLPWAGLFDLFRIGIGPSSSHTVGPMMAAGRFIAELPPLQYRSITVDLYGSLALTGKGHATDTALALGLLGQKPDTVDPDAVPVLLEGLRASGCLTLRHGVQVPFHPETDVIFRKREVLPRHANGMAFTAMGQGNDCVRRVFYSIGGGFIVEDGEDGEANGFVAPAIPYPFGTSADLLSMASAAGLTIAELQRQNERAIRSDREITEGIARIWAAMRSCVERGLHQRGELPGGLKVRRRAPGLHERLLARARTNEADPMRGMDWVNLYALAVNEENASGGRVVTAPTNGAAGIVPAVLHYYVNFVPGSDDQGIETFLLAASAVGSLIKRNASISGAEVGCQGEVGSASAMAAAGLAAALGGNNMQVENAAEIGLEHNLGLTCDPIGGLVQIPCIERNAIGAVKAINAARLALHGDGAHHVSLDQVIRTMRETGHDMLSKYKETSEGGLAVNAIEC